MPQLERNFDDADYQLILDSSGTTVDIAWDTSTGDYIRLSTFNSNTNAFIGSFYSNQNHFQIYTATTSGQMYVSPNEALNDSYKDIHLMKYLKLIKTGWITLRILWVI